MELNENEGNEGRHGAYGEKLSITQLLNKEVGNEVLLPSKSLPDLVMVLQTVKKDAYDVAGSLTSLLSSLRLALSQVFGNSIDDMRFYTDVAGQVQEFAPDATHGKFIGSTIVS